MHTCISISMVEWWHISIHVYCGHCGNTSEACVYKDYPSFSQVLNCALCSGNLFCLNMFCDMRFIDLMKTCRYTYLYFDFMSIVHMTMLLRKNTSQCIDYWPLGISLSSRQYDGFTNLTDVLYRPIYCRLNFCPLSLRECQITSQ